MTNPHITVLDNGVLVGEYEPGNGTRYTAVAVPWAFEDMMGALGQVSEGWLGGSGNTARTYLLQRGGYLVDDYIQSKFGGLPGDYPYFGDLIRALTGRKENT
tara:strand:+ start:2797 stop:3102 length:306 start_codon:yes stop_codon:yes gene_type:complete